VKNIVYDYQIFSEQEIGGISRYFSKLASYILRNNEFNLKIAAFFHKNSYLESIDKSILLGKYIDYRPYTTMARITLNRTLTSLYYQATKPDIIHQTYYSYPEFIPKNSKVVVTVHDMIHENFSDYMLRHDRTAENKARAVSRADHIICVSNNTKKDLISILNVDPRRVTVIHHGCSKLINVEQQANLITKVDKPYILYVGQRKFYKNFKRFVQAYSMSIFAKDYSLVCFGGGDFTLEERNFFTELKLTNQQIVCVSGDDYQLAYFYKNAATFVYPSLYEGFGMPLLEAMSLGCPVICSNTSSFPEIAGNAAILFEPTSVESIRVAVERVLSSPCLAANLAKLGYEQVKKFSWDKCARKTSEIYRLLL
jgi:glycosyltransferase involved in cell wall biosynthesis